MLKKKGTCLLESLIAYKDSLFTNETNWLNHSRTTITLGFKQFDRDCKNPPNPPGKRTKTELKRYREELADLLSQDCQNIQARARGMLQSWAEDKATPNPVHLEKLAQDIESAT